MPASDPCVPCLGIVSRTFLEHLVLFLINALHSVFTFICSLSLLKESLCVFSLSKDSLHHFSFSHSFLFYLFLPFFTFHQFLSFSPGNVPRRDNIVSFLPSCTSLYVPVHVCMYGYLCTHTSLAPMSRDTAQRSGGETFDSILVRFSD